MLWNFGYETIQELRNCGNSELSAKMEEALDYAKGHAYKSPTIEDDDFIVIKVEGYRCIALVTDEFEPKEVAERIFPFDENRIYPMQEVEVVPQFKRY